MKSRRLLRRPRPYPDESLGGYIIRLTETNYYSSPKWIFQMSGLRARGIYGNVFNREKDDLSRLSNISDVEADILWSMAFPANTLIYPKAVKQVKVFGNIVPTDALNRQQIQLCPICLQEKPYYRFFWELSVVSACPLHH
ncbi:TniQ family protein [Lyngbya aestuarii]